MSFAPNSYTPKQIEVLAELLDEEHLYIVDVGASGGAHQRWSNLRDQCHMLMVEPDAEAAEQLRLSSGENVIVKQVALSDKREERVFYHCRKQQVSSLYQPNWDFLRRFQGLDRFDILEHLTFKATTLDGLLADVGWCRADILKLDTQGHELAALRGGEKTLHEVVALEVEVEFAPIYQEQPLFGDVDAYLRSNGFELFDLSPCRWSRSQPGCHPEGRGQIIFADALYLRPPEQLASNDLSHLQRAAACYLLYNRPDLLGTLENELPVHMKLLVGSFGGCA